MQPNNYGSAELKIKPNAGFIAKSIKSNELSLLYCTRTEDEYIHSCMYSTCDNIRPKTFTGTEYLQTAKVCNFTITPPTEVRIFRRRRFDTKFNDRHKY